MTRLRWIPVSAASSDLTARVEIGEAVLRYFVHFDLAKGGVWLAQHGGAELARGQLGEAIDCCEWHADEYAAALCGEHENA